MLLTDARAFPISSPELPRLALKKNIYIYILFIHPHVLWKSQKKTCHNKKITHNGVCARNRGCVAGDSKAVGASVEASRVSSVHFTALQGIVLRWKRQRLWFLKARKNNYLLETKMLHYKKVCKLSLGLNIHPRCEGKAHQSVLWIEGSEGTMLTEMGGVSHHCRITLLNHRPSRAPWMGGWMEAFCLCVRVEEIIWRQ